MTMTTIDRDIKAAVDYILMQFTNTDIPKDALRVIVEDRIRMACADALRCAGRQGLYMAPRTN